MAEWLAWDGCCAHAPAIFPRLALAPTVCAELHLAARAHIDELNLDRVVAGLFAPLGAEPERAHSSRLCCLLADARELTGEKDPLTAVAAALRELREARLSFKQLLKFTDKSNVHAAMAYVKVACQELAQCRCDDSSSSSKHGHASVGELLVELQSARQQQHRLITFVGLKVPRGVDALEQAVEAALTRLKQRERERLKLVRLRNDVFGAVAKMESERPQAKLVGKHGAEAKEVRLRKVFH